MLQGICVLTRCQCDGFVIFFAVIFPNLVSWGMLIVIVEHVVHTKPSPKNQIASAPMSGPKIGNKDNI